MTILNVHNVLAMILIVISLAATLWAPARRYVLYVLVLQIVVGAAVWGITKYPPPLAHWVLAILNGGTYAMASVFEKRGRPRPVVMGVLVLGFVVFVVVYGLGMMNAPHAPAPAA